jgi:hypothetical protein
MVDHLTTQHLDPSILGPPIAILEERHHPASEIPRREHPTGVQQIIEEITPIIHPQLDPPIKLVLRHRMDIPVGESFIGPL